MYLPPLPLPLVLLTFLASVHVASATTSFAQSLVDNKGARSQVYTSTAKRIPVHIVRWTSCKDFVSNTASWVDIPQDMWQNGHSCGKWVVIKFSDSHPTAVRMKVRDRCDSCAKGEVGLSARLYGWLNSPKTFEWYWE
ncbi:hypothetical protein T439DRAFT_351560 [Meredithblackwellia eburnea MCA 4105]